MFAILAEVTCRAYWVKYLLRLLLSSSSSLSSCLLPPLVRFHLSWSDFREGDGKFIYVDIDKNDQGSRATWSSNSHPPNLSNAFPRSPSFIYGCIFCGGTRPPRISIFILWLRLLLPEPVSLPASVSLPTPVFCWRSHLLWRYLSASRSQRPSRIDGCIFCDSTRPPWIGSAPSRPGQSCWGLKRFLPRFLLPLLKTSQRSLRLKIGRWHALWPGECHKFFGAYREVILLDINGSKVRTQKITFLVVNERVEKKLQGRRKIHPKSRTLK